MSKDHWMIIGLALYVSLFIGAVSFLGLWRIKRRRERAPLEFKLLRGPGEALRRRIAKDDEDSVFYLSGAAMFPLLLLLVPMLMTSWSKPTTWTDLYLRLGSMAVVFICGAVLSGAWMLKKLNRYRDDRLGYLGERAVGEVLLSLIKSGYQIYHDVPAEVRGKKFNIDHVAVGPNGVFAIETKTRRKGRTRPGYEEHKVAYDGEQLIWPWAEDDYGLQQTEARARWLTEWLNKMTGFGLAAKPILVLPGWYVVPKGIGPVTVVNHKQLVGAILRAPADVLTPEQVDLIGRQLEAVCRDVED
jgi:hypothetical protein